MSTRMIAVHRRAVLERVKADLKAPGRVCRVIATSLVEAGVDIDFPRVWRAEAGLDSVLQAAGRCNREGSRPRGASVVTVFRSPDWPSPREVKALAGDMSRIAQRHADLGTLAAIEDYFEEVYWRKGTEALDREGVLRSFRADRSGTDFAFRSVADAFRLIEEAMVPVIVRWDDKSRKAVDALSFAERTGGIARRLQPYIVQVPPKDRESLCKFGRVRFVAEDRRGDQFAVLEDKDLYDDALGLLWEEADELAPSKSLL